MSSRFSLKSLYCVVVIALSAALSACIHPVEVAGQGDVQSASGERDCSLETSPCEFPIVEEYNETYTAVPRPGYSFSHWESCLDEQGNRCVWDISADAVAQNWGKTMPAMVAHFASTSAPPDLPLSFSTPPIDLGGANAQFAKDVAYGDHARNKLDIFLPTSSETTGLVIYIHGGGFISGNKELAYNRAAEIRTYLREGLAFASINYRYLQRNPDGLLASLNDAKRALQFLRYYRSTFNINAAKVVVFGDSAGAGTSLWLATRDDMAEPNSADPVERESTRVRGAAVLETQASYDVLTWETNVFESLGITVAQMVAADNGLRNRILHSYNISSISELDSNASRTLRQQMNMLAFVSADDPELFIASLAQPAGFPSSQSELLHHPLHAQAVKQRADQVGLSTVSYVPQLGINHPSGENHVQYLIRELR